MSEQKRAGKVYLVGAGPGAPGLITLRGVECLRRADVVLYDYLVSSQILYHARHDAQRICLGRPGEAQIWTQPEINAKTVELAMAGQTVVRLKGGDPAVFARGDEEVEALVEHGIPFEIVPGIPAALAAVSYAGVPITQRHWSSAVALVTAQEMSSKSAPGIDYSKLARFPGTLIVDRGVSTEDLWAEELLAGGMSPKTPALIVRRCSFLNQITVSCTVGQLRERLTGPNELRLPVIVVIGDAAGGPRVASWFDQLPLFGQMILVTRPAGQAITLAKQLEEHGAQVLLQPAIELREPADWAPADAALAQISRFDWLVFSSVNGVHAFMERLQAQGSDLRALGAAKLAAIGPATVDALRKYYLQVDRYPHRYQAEDLADVLIGDAASRRFLLVRASRGRDVLAQRLAAAGADVEQVVFYESHDVAEADPEISRAMHSGHIAWTTVTSSAIARSLANMFAGDLEKTRLASISPITSATFRELGFEPSVEASHATMGGIVQAILRYGS